MRTISYKQYAHTGVVLLDGHVQIHHYVRQLARSDILTVQIVPVTEI